MSLPFLPELELSFHFGLVFGVIPRDGLFDSVFHGEGGKMKGKRQGSTRYKAWSKLSQGLRWSWTGEMTLRNRGLVPIWASLAGIRHEPINSIEASRVPFTSVPCALV